MSPLFTQTVVGEVVAGDKVGRTLGFPTANLSLSSGLKIPQLDNGVYTVICYLPYFNSERCEQLGLNLGEDRQVSFTVLKPYLQTPGELNKLLPGGSPEQDIQNLTPYPGLLHYGPRATFNDEQAKWEVYLYDFDYLIYGQLMVVTVLKKLRGTHKFTTPEALIEQMQQDKKTGVEFFTAAQKFYL